MGEHTATSNPVVGRRQFGEPGECAYCEKERAKQKDGAIPFFPPHDASSGCESGKHNHCTCDTCF